jgi:hypothetical protein
VTLWGRSGGGGGHQLKVNQITVLINASENDETEPKVIEMKDFRGENPI